MHRSSGPRKKGITNFRFMSNWGMHRLGFSVDEIPLLIRRLKSQNAVIPSVGILYIFVGKWSA